MEGSINTHSPLISIITITFNAEKELPATLKSIEAQSFEDYENIIIDGASKDKTLEIVNNFATHRTKIVSEPDNGLYDAMNKGLKLAKGKYIIFLNAGDSFHSDKILEKYAQACYKDYDIIYGDTDIVDSDRQRKGPRHLSVPEKLTVKSFSKGMLVCHQAFMVKKELAPLYDLSYRFSADYDWTIKCIRNSAPENNHNLRTITIDYLSDGLTDKNMKASLRERFRIMCKVYGIPRTLLNHLLFLFRALRRKLSR